MTSPLDHAHAYHEVFDRVSSLVRELDDDQVATVVPAAPAWSIHDLIAHYAGAVSDVLVLNIESAGSDEWTDVQVTSRRDRSLESVVKEWAENLPAFLGLMPDIPIFQRGQVVFDAVTHEHDLRGAMARPGARDSDAFAIGWAWAMGIVGQMRDGYEAGALRVRTEKGDEVAGAGDVTATVSAPTFEIFRAMTGRRCVDQVKAFDWDGDVAVGHLCFLPCRDEPLVE